MLMYLQNFGIMDEQVAETTLNAMKQKELLAKKHYIEEVHPHKITPPHGKEKRWKTYLDTSNGRKLLAKTSEDEFFDYLYKLYNGEAKEKRVNPHYVTVEKLYPEWLKYKSLHTKSQSYIERINNTWKSFYKDKEISKTPLPDLDKLALDEWVHTLIKEHNLTRKQFYNITVIMRQVLNYACDKELIQSNPMDRVKVDSRRMFRREEKKDDETQVFTDAEINQLTVLAYTDYKTKTQKVHVLAPLAVLFQFQTGLRIGELCALRYEDVKGNYLHVCRMASVGSKYVMDYLKGNAEARDVFLTDMAQNIIKEAFDYQTANGLPNDGYIFSVNDKPVLYSSVTKLYTKYCEKIGTPHKSSHKARKTYISSLIDAGVNINTVRKMVGHSDEKTTLHNYVFDRSEESLRNEIISKALSFKS